MAPKSIKRVVKKYLKKIFGEPERLRGLRVISAAGHPPAPLTGDVGRDCGDASRALLFVSSHSIG
jgi:hypothetical protein